MSTLTATLGELTAHTRPICYGVLKPGPYVPDGVPLLRILDIKDNVVNDTDVHRISAELDAEFARSRLRGGEVLLSIQGTVGRVAICPTRLAGANISRTVAIIDPDDRVDKRYLRLFLLHLASANRLELTGTTRDSLNIATIRSIPVPLLPLAEQRRVVALLEDHLSRLDAGSNGLARAAARSALLKRAALDAAVRSVSTRQAELAELVERVEAGKSFTCDPRMSREGEWGVIKVSAMTWGKFLGDENKAVPAGRAIDPRHQIHAGDILVSRANTSEYVGSPVRVDHQPDHLLLSDKSLRLVPKPGVSPDWLIVALSGPSTRRQISSKATGTKDSMRNISQGALLSVTIPLPLESTDQSRVVARAQAVNEAQERLDSEVSVARDRAAALRRSLLAAAFSGRL